MSNERHDEASLRALLPWMAAGKLSGAEREQVQTWLDASPEARAELAWWQAVGRDLRAHSAEQMATHEGDVGLARFQQALAQLPERSTPSLPTGGRLQRWLQWWRVNWQSPALAACLLVIVTQSVMWQRPVSAPAALEALSGAQTTSAGSFLVAFEPTASEADIRALMRTVQAEIVGGPSALGLYRIQVRGDVGAARQQLEQARGVVTDVRPAD